MPPSTLLLALVLGVGCGEFKKGFEKGVERQKKAAQERAKASNPEPPKATPEKLITDPIVEKALRKSLKKPTGELTKSDLKKVTELSLEDNDLTELPKGLELLTQLEILDLSYTGLTSVKGLEKLTQLKSLYLRDNPDLTKAQIAELQKALPKCKIESNPKK